MVKLQDIANRLGLSVTTVSYSLNNDPRIPESTRQKVITTAAEMGYAGRSGKSSAGNNYMRQLVLCLNSVDGGIYSEIIEAMKKTLNLNNCELMVYIGSAVDRLRWLDGLFVLNSKVTNESIEKITQKKIPVVLMDRDVTIDSAANVTLDNFGGCFATTEYAINAGARSFAFIGGPRESYESRFRLEGFTSALEEHRMFSTGSVILQTDFTYEGGLNACRFIMEHGKIPDAIICANDETAMGILAGLKTGNVTKNVLVTGFDGTRPREPIRFVTAKADHKHWGTTAAYTILQMFEHVSIKQALKIPVNIVEYNT